MASSSRASGPPGGNGGFVSAATRRSSAFASRAKNFQKTSLQWREIAGSATNAEIPACTAGVRSALSSALSSGLVAT